MGDTVRRERLVSGALPETVRIPDGAGGSLTARIHPPDAASGTAAAPLLCLTHGAGGNLDTPGLVALAERLAGAGVRTLRYNLPAAEAGRRRPDRPAAAVRAMAAVAAWGEAAFPGAAHFLGGRSFGGRMTSLFLADPEARAGDRFAGGVLLAYPLKPPGKGEVPPERIAHLPRTPTPLLFVSGDRDPFAPPALLNPVVGGAAGGRARVVWIAGGDHGFRVRRDRLRSEGRTPRFGPGRSRRRRQPLAHHDTKLTRGVAQQARLS